MPPNLESGLICVFNFLFSFLELVIKLVYIVILFLLNIFTIILTNIIQYGPFLFKTFSSMLSFTFWISSRLIQGILGMGDKTTNTLSWLILLCASYLYFDYKGYLFRLPSSEQTPTPPEPGNSRTTNRNSDSRPSTSRGSRIPHRDAPHNPHRDTPHTPHRDAPHTPHRDAPHTPHCDAPHTPHRDTPLAPHRDAPHTPHRDDNATSGARRRIIQNIAEQLNLRSRERTPCPLPRQSGTIEVQQHHEYSADTDNQHEVENQENENEANSQEEADRNHMQDDNLSNSRREQNAGTEAAGRGGGGNVALCVICLDNERNVAVFPCGHTHLCLTCVQRLCNSDGPCPMCQRNIEEYRQIFV